MKRMAAVLVVVAGACTQAAETNLEDGGPAVARHSSSSAGAGGTSSTASSGGGAGDGGMGASSSSTSSSSSSSSTSSSSSSSTGGSSGNGTPRAFVYGHSEGSLYVLDADTLAVTNLGPFVWHDPAGVILNDQMTDLAVNGNGELWGCSFNALYRVDPATVTATKVADLSDSYNGLTFVPAGMLDEMDEVLVGASNTLGNLYRINLTNGHATSLGRYGGTWNSSGDLVAINGDGMYATVVALFGGDDKLARVDPMNGNATVMTASIGFNHVWGLGYWAGVLYGFTEAGQVITINTTTGVGTLLYQRSEVFWGAGVTTNAKVTQ